jgi:hypothetical protein
MTVVAGRSKHQPCMFWYIGMNTIELDDQPFVQGDVTHWQEKIMFLQGTSQESKFFEYTDGSLYSCSLNVSLHDEL